MRKTCRCGIWCQKHNIRQHLHKIIPSVLTDEADGTFTPDRRPDEDGPLLQYCFALGYAKMLYDELPNLPASGFSRVALVISAWKGNDAPADAIPVPIALFGSQEAGLLQY